MHRDNFIFTLLKKGLSSHFYSSWLDYIWEVKDTVSLYLLIHFNKHDVLNMGLGN